MTYPDSSLKAQMEYYIEPAEQDASVNTALAAITPTNIEPESIKVIDPACGSGHILVEAYDVLKAIYEERGYRSRDIPKLILENNLVGLDIDDRAAQLAGFALIMKAREDDRRVFIRDIKLNVFALQSTQGLNVSELWRKLALNKDAKRGMTESIFDDAQTNLVDELDDANFTALESILVLFEQAKTFGSLIQVPADKAEFLNEFRNQLQALAEQGDSFQKPAATVLLPLVKQAWLLVQRYDAVVANPPYMGGKGMNPELKVFAQKHFPDSKSDLFAMFIERGFCWCKPMGFSGMVTMQSWMFLSSYQAMREKLLGGKTLSNMVHMGNGVMGIAFGTAATVFCNTHVDGYEGSFSYCENDAVNENGVPKQFPVQNERLKTAKPDDFKKIPGSPVAYWVSESIRNNFANGKKLVNFAEARRGLSTGNNENFIRWYWYEVSLDKIALSGEGNHSLVKTKKWFPYNKAGSFCRWYGNNDLIVNWHNNGQDIKTQPERESGDRGWRDTSCEYYFKDGITWGGLTSAEISFRWSDYGAIFDTNKGPMMFPTSHQKVTLGFLSSKLVSIYASLLNPALSIQNCEIDALPVIWDKLNNDQVSFIVDRCICLSKKNWQTQESSWEFLQFVGWVSDSVTQQTEATDVGLRDKAANPTYKLSNIYANWQAKNRQTIAEMQRLEQENNRLFIDAYGLQDELEPDVPLEQITLTINPKYRYGGNLSDEELALRFQSDTLAELISYAIGCINWIVDTSSTASNGASSIYNVIENYRNLANSAYEGFSSALRESFRVEIITRHPRLSTNIR